MIYEVVRGMKDEDYRAREGVSQSTLKAFMECPQKFRLSPKKESTPAMRYGSYVDAMWLSRDVSRFAVQPPDIDFRTKDGKAWKAENADKTIITCEQHACASRAIERLNATPQIREARESCDVQVAVFAEIEGVQCKGLIDLCPKDGVRGALADLKTAPSADPKEWGRYAYNNGLAIQAAMYLDLWNLAAGEDLQEFWHIVSEQEPPHEPCMMALSTEFIQLGRAQYRSAIRRYAECVEKDEWPGYEMCLTIEPPKWATIE